MGRTRLDEPIIRRRTDDGDAWKLQAVCAEHDPKLWATDDPRAKQICITRCPVVDQCLRYVMVDIGKKVPGTWGGTTFAERNPKSPPPGRVLARGPGGKFV